MPQGRRVRRVIRKFDTWSVARIAICFHLCMALIFLTAGVVLWEGARSAGFIDKIEKTVRSNLQYKTWVIHGSAVFKGALIASVILALVFTVLTVVGAMLYNLLSDVVGGVQIWVLEEIPDPVEALVAATQGAPEHSNGSANGRPPDEKQPAVAGRWVG